ncbi:MAG: YicC family protein [Bacteroidales bacterium]|nr:YicC family protein [Bacteroidales bacterium]
MKSMTGFAKKQCCLDGKKITIEIKTLNSKQMDANVKMPANYRSHELDIRAMLNRLERGKIDFMLNEELSNDTAQQLNRELLTNRFNELKELSASLGEKIDPTSLLTSIIARDDVWSSNTDNELADEAWQQLSAIIGEAIDEVDATRQHEGEILKADFGKHIDLIEKYLGEIPQFESQRIEIAKERIRAFLNEAGVEVDQNRFEQELIYYLEKLDITEEKVRLAKHINYFREVMENEEGSGKKLGFIAQEMGREINTTGSKANHVEIQKRVVAMKDELEKIKEQLGNIL